jgi:hypothetical protein
MPSLFAPTVLALHPRYSIFVTSEPGLALQNLGKSDSPTLENSTRITSISYKLCRGSPTRGHLYLAAGRGGTTVQISLRGCLQIHACLFKLPKARAPASPLPLPCPAQISVGLDLGEVPNASRYGSHSVSSDVGHRSSFLLHLWEFFVTTLTSSGLSHVYLLCTRAITSLTRSVTSFVTCSQVPDERIFVGNRYSFRRNEAPTRRCSTWNFFVCTPLCNTHKCPQKEIQTMVF